MTRTGKHDGATLIQGGLLHRHGQRQIAIYLRDSVTSIAAFNGDAGELYSPGAWQYSDGARRLAAALSRGEVETVSPLPGVVAQRIESLHRSAGEALAGAFLRRVLAALTGGFRQPKPSTQTH